MDYSEEGCWWWQLSELYTGAVWGVKSQFRHKLEYEKYFSASHAFIMPWSTKAGTEKHGWVQLFPDNWSKPSIFDIREEIDVIKLTQTATSARFVWVTKEWHNFSRTTDSKSFHKQEWSGCESDSNFEETARIELYFRGRWKQQTESRLEQMLVS